MSSLFSPRSQWMPLPAFTGWGFSKDLPRFVGKSFRQRILESDRKLSDAQVETKQQKNITTKNMQEHAPALQNKTEQFTKELIALGGFVYRTKNPAQDIIEFLKLHGFKKIMLEPNTLDRSLFHKAGIEFTSEPNPEILVGVTNALCGLADTGSVLEADGALYASLLPEIHIAVLKSRDILPSLPDAMDFVKEKKSAVFITGPSRTADIEMTLTIGVHGPREIHVFVDDSISG